MAILIPNWWDERIGASPVERSGWSVFDPRYLESNIVYDVRQFFRNLSGEIFFINQYMYEKFGFFPLLRYPIESIIERIRRSPYLREFDVSFYRKENKKHKLWEPNGVEGRCRFFLLSDESAWLKVVELPYFISKDTKGIGNPKKPDVDYLQVLHFAFARALEIHARDKENSKIILLVIRVECYAEEFDELLASGELDNVPHIVYSQLKSEYQSINDKRRKKLEGGILLQTFDLRKYINEDRSKDIIETNSKFWNEYDRWRDEGIAWDSKEDVPPQREEPPKSPFFIPYVILAGIVIK